MLVECLLLLDPGLSHIPPVTYFCNFVPAVTFLLISQVIEDRAAYVKLKQNTSCTSFSKAYHTFTTRWFPIVVRCLLSQTGYSSF